MLRIIFIAISLLTWFSINAQDFPYGKIAKEEFEKGAYAPHAVAIVLQEFGRSRIEYNEIKNDLVLRFIYHTKILIKNKEGLEYANFSIPLYRSNNNKETIEGIKGTTFNLLDDSKIEKIELEKKNILTEKVSENREVVKIALSNVKEGSIIELRYTTESPFLHNLESWQFQSYIPKMHSEFISEIPEICHYNVNIKGYIKLETRKQLPYDTKISTSTGDVRGTQTTYIAKDIPAFIREDYMTSPRNFMGTLTFELASFSIPFGPSYNYARTWEDVRNQLYGADEFGKEMNRSSLFKNIIPTLIKEDMSTYDKANSIYKHIQSQIRWNKNYGLFAENGIKKALENRNGNIGDINLALICALREAKIEANPVILSTRDNGLPPLFRPTITDYNYVLAHITIDSTEYLVDASDVNTPFGQLPLRCINYQGNLLTKQGYKFVQLNSLLPSKISYNFEGELDEDGTLRGMWSEVSNGYAATNKREEIKNYNSLEEYKEKIYEDNSSYKINSHEIRNLEDVSQLLTEIKEIEFKNFANKNGKELKFIPFIKGRTIKNPFNLDERTYPVDLGSKIEESFILNIKLPKSYQVKNKPKNMNIALPNRDARYIYIIKENDGILNIQIQSSLNKPLFLPEEYLDLKEFFSHIIQSQTLDITVEQSAI
ncbi:transglutaminase domain-containing protein [Sphingobacterium composti Ten et al. 2007 non Yoo et al. 2007]|uniref:transglutaminase domain-containing protein n=1 Tax=Sphingobacterium composti TaxID=363260 RepID=UPI00135A9E7E|nr:transglutaminase domain-containing protein [Sphingobacterium composti Ten et al. 2007 non Yoo et al. 2007]